jgi:hypothetical protein
MGRTLRFDRGFANDRNRRNFAIRPRSSEGQSPPTLAVQRRSLEWRVCAVEPPFIGPRVIDRARP